MPKSTLIYSLSILEWVSQFSLIIILFYIIFNRILKNSDNPLLKMCMLPIKDTNSSVRENARLAVKAIKTIDKHCLIIKKKR